MFILGGGVPPSSSGGDHQGEKRNSQLVASLSDSTDMMKEILLDSKMVLQQVGSAEEELFGDRARITTGLAEVSAIRFSVTHRVTCKQVAVTGTNSKDIKAMLKSRCDIPACLAVGRILADRAREADVYTTAYTPRDSDKFEGKVRAVVQSLIDSGIDVKVYLD
ncbi:unnamed protein product [Cuscuta campestris]|uniref:L18 ribosomal protein Heart Stopper n=1 Tax=Cuscuta campestris TaxID=132261 RepID=A0A484N332_9ASTE|nr:unnamed protein product [Cuscuta campestris]